MHIRYISSTQIKHVIVFLVGSALFSISCKNKKTTLTPIDHLIKKYARLQSDSLKLLCARFLKENMDDLPSEELYFYNIKTHERRDVVLDSISSEQSLNLFLERNNLSFLAREVIDVNAVSEAMLEKNINKAIADWNKYPWSKHVPIDVFLNYLLPYKVLNDYPEDWRTYFYLRYKDSINSQVASHFADTSNYFYKDPNNLYYSILVNEVGTWFHYSTIFKKLRKAPSLSELMCVRQGDCLQWAYLNTYILRALGIPSTIDIIPSWGSKNGGHASEVFWDGHSTMRSPAGRSFERPAKVFRLSIKKQNLWRDSLRPLIGKNICLLSHLQNDHWYDVTGEHTGVANIEYRLPEDERKKHLYAYICVMNYGSWEPVFYGKVDSSNKVVFTNMGLNMLYQVALPHGDNYKLVGNFFMVDSLGKIHNNFSQADKKTSLKLTKINNGLESYVRNGKEYKLKWIDKNGKWQSSRAQTCTNDSSITIKIVPDASFYMLSEINNNTRLERIFSFKDGKQEWW